MNNPNEIIDNKLKSIAAKELKTSYDLLLSEGFSKDDAQNILALFIVNLVLKAGQNEHK